MPTWVLSFPTWVMHSYTHGLFLIWVGIHANLTWLVIVGRCVAFLAGVVLVGLYRVASTNAGKRD